MAKEYITTDLGCAAFLINSGVTLLRIDHLPAKSNFVFDGEVSTDMVNKYWADDGLVNPRTFTITLRDLKTRLHNERGSM